MTLVTLQAITTSFAGALLGAALVSTVQWLNLDTRPDLGFASAIVVLATLTAGLASIPPAAVATYRDPVRILRVP